MRSTRRTRDSRDLNDKYLILVNGRKVNDTYFFGALTELDLSMLGDFERIEVVRGPGSALYGSGAIGGVINLITRDGKSLEPEQKEETRLRISTGLVERYENLSVSHIRRLNEAMNLSLFYGVDHYTGIEDDKAPLYYPFGSHYGTADKPARGGPNGRFDNYKAAFDNEPRHKLMLTLDADNFTSWLRFTRGSLQGQAAWWLGDGDPLPGNANEDRDRIMGYRYQQITWHNEYLAEWNDAVKTKIEAGVQVTDVDQTYTGKNIRQVQTQELMSRVTNTFDIADGHQLALGGELVWNAFGCDSIFGPMIDGQEPDKPGVVTDDFFVLKKAVFGEYQGKLSDSLTFFAGARIDQREDAETTVSPRGALIWTPSDEDTFRLSWNRSFRSLGDWAIWNDIHKRGAKITPNESIDYWELAYRRQITSDLSGTLTFFNYEQETVSSNIASGTQVPIGVLKVAGLEAELEWISDSGWHLGLSHSITQLYDFSQDTFTTQYVTTDGVGPGSPAGSELMSWPTHSSKLFLHAPVSDKLSLDSSLLIAWYYPGFADVHDYYKTHPVDNDYGNEYKEDPAFKPRFGPIFQLNLGATWEFNANHSLRFDAYNILALFDRDITISHYRAEPDYRVEPATFALTYEFKF